MKQTNKNYLSMATTARSIINLSSNENQVLTDFAGLILKIKHSCLWNHAPRTMKYLRQNNLLEHYFSEYAINFKFNKLEELSATNRSLKFLRFLCQYRYHRSSLNVNKLVFNANHEYNILVTKSKYANDKSSNNQNPLITYHMGALNNSRFLFLSENTIVEKYAPQTLTLNKSHYCIVYQHGKWNLIKSEIKTFILLSLTLKQLSISEIQSCAKAFDRDKVHTSISELYKSGFITYGNIWK